MNNTFVTWLLGAAVAGTRASSPLGNSHRCVFGHGRRLCLADDERRGSRARGGVVLAGRRASACDLVNDRHDLHGGLLILLDEIDGHGRPSRTPRLLGSSASLSAPAGLMGGCGTPTAPCAEAPCGSIRPCDVAAYAGASSGCGVVACGRSSCPACGNAARAATSCGQTLSARPPATTARESTGTVRRASTSARSCSSTRRSPSRSASPSASPGRPRAVSSWISSSPTPIYFAPGTGFPGGEDVLITLTVTDAQGNEYSDQMKLHVNDAH